MEEVKEKNQAPAFYRSMHFGKKEDGYEIFTSIFDSTKNVKLTSEQKTDLVKDLRNKFVEWMGKPEVLSKRNLTLETYDTRNVSGGFEANIGLVHNKDRSEYARVSFYFEKGRKGFYVQLALLDLAPEKKEFEELRRDIEWSVDAMIDACKRLSIELRDTEARKIDPVVLARNSGSEIRRVTEASDGFSKSIAKLPKGEEIEQLVDKRNTLCDLKTTLDEDLTTFTDKLDGISCNKLKAFLR